MADSLRIEIPVEVVNKTDAGALNKLESELNKMYSAPSNRAAQLAGGNPAR